MRSIAVKHTQVEGASLDVPVAILALWGSKRHAFLFQPEQFFLRFHNPGEGEKLYLDTQKPKGKDM